MGSLDTALAMKIKTFTLDDIPNAIAMNYAAFPGAESQKMMPDTAGARQWWLDVYRHDYVNRRQHSQFVKVVETVGGSMVAYARWDRASLEERGPRYPAWHADMNHAACNQFIEHSDGTRKRIMGADPHYFLDTVVTHPDHQGKGAGSMLVKWGCDLADQEGVAAYVDASEEGASLYKRFGFEARRTPDNEYAVLVRKARSV
ncbi:uncharacterized protein TRUGW13939_04792 [Talaromyces rugulosus]|uniref:N-acetyltransferase domain-containing protein n=1 Tax=Talaromyces rugulosus TaxID=121627 RepID=A0A7H8QUI6_TALRU|nr:uncharacterized protein TRUGW13939_04792 [Talaromyces rugulosus]QKX57674.1 hypothetical protein TRUGW13939_04792 [Talaromyces rugulosus]